MEAGNFLLCVCCLKMCLDLRTKRWERDWILIDIESPLGIDKSSVYTDEQDSFVLKRFEFNQYVLLASFYFLYL